MNSWAVRFLVVVGLLVLVGCGSDDSDKDAANNGNNVNNVNNSNNGNNANNSNNVNNLNNSNNANNANNAEVCDRNGFSVASGMAEIYPNVGVHAEMRAGEDPTDVMLFYFLGTVGRNFGPGTYMISEQNYANCSICVTVSAECVDFDCTRDFLAVSGAISIDTVDDRLTGTLSDARFVEVVVDDNDVSTPVEDGQTWCMEETTFDVPAEVNAPVECDPNQPQPVLVAEQAVMQPGEGDLFELRYEGRTSETDPTTVITFDLEGELESQMGTTDFVAGPLCDSCARVGVNCTAGTCEKTFVVRTGNIDINRQGFIGDEFAALLTDVRYTEHEFDTETSTWVEVEDGDTYCISSLTIGATITEPAD